MRKRSGLRCSRRHLLATGAAALLASPSRGHATPSPLKVAAASGGLIYGSAGGRELFDDAAYRELFLAEAALLTPENALKFDALQPRQGDFDFAGADALVDWARSHGLLVRGHTLIWNDRTPPWLAALSRCEVERAFDAHLDAVVPHFAGRLHAWDVVNEPFWLGRDHPGTFRPGPWYDAFGPDYVARAFRRTAALDPRAKLVLNEAWTERADPVGLAVRRSLLRLVDRLQDAGVKLDAVGLQSHLFPGVSYDEAGFVEFLHALAERRVDIILSEFDIDDESFPRAGLDEAVAHCAGSFLRAALTVPAVTTVVTWGLSDRYSWWRDASVMAAHGLTRLPRPLPYDDLLRRKPMANAMAAAFSERRTPHHG